MAREPLHGPQGRDPDDAKHTEQRHQRRDHGGLRLLGGGVADGRDGSVPSFALDERPGATRQIGREIHSPERHQRLVLGVEVRALVAHGAVAQGPRERVEDAPASTRDGAGLCARVGVKQQLPRGVGDVAIDSAPLAPRQQRSPIEGEHERPDGGAVRPDGSADTQDRSDGELDGAVFAAHVVARDPTGTHWEAERGAEVVCVSLIAQLGVAHGFHHERSYPLDAHQLVALAVKESDLEAELGVGLQVVLELLGEGEHGWCRPTHRRGGLGEGRTHVGGCGKGDNVAPRLLNFLLQVRHGLIELGRLDVQLAVDDRALGLRLGKERRCHKGASRHEPGGHAHSNPPPARPRAARQGTLRSRLHLVPP